MKNCIKMWMKTCFHSYFCANFHEFFFMMGIWYSFTLLVSHMFWIHLKWQSSSFRLHENFPNFYGSNDIFPNSTGPRLRLQKGRKFHLVLKLERILNTALQNKNQTQNTAGAGIFISFWNRGQGLLNLGGASIWTIKLGGNLIQSKLECHSKMD